MRAEATSKGDEVMWTDDEDEVKCEYCKVNRVERIVKHVDKYDGEELLVPLCRTGCVDRLTCGQCGVKAICEMRHDGYPLDVRFVCLGKECARKTSRELHLKWDKFQIVPAFKPLPVRWGIHRRWLMTDDEREAGN